MHYSKNYSNMELTPSQRVAFCRSYRITRSLLENNRQSSTRQRTQTNKYFKEISCSSVYETFNEKSDNNTKYKECAIYGPSKEFSSDFSTLLTDPVFSDVDIKCGDEVIKAHKNILASRSPVFYAMFNTSMVESATGVVTIEELDSEVVRDFLVFIYSNKVKNISLPKACALLEASTKYQVETLKDVCVDYLITELTIENSLLILQKADLYDKKLKRRSLAFINDNFSGIRKTEDWMDMQKNNPVLALEVCNCVIDKMSENN